MSLAVVYTRASLGVQAPGVSIEVHISNGLPALTLVGLPETTVKGSQRSGSQRHHQLRVYLSGQTHHRQSCTR